MGVAGRVGGLDQATRAAARAAAPRREIEVGSSRCTAWQLPSPPPLGRRPHGSQLGACRPYPFPQYQLGPGSPNGHAALASRACLGRRQRTHRAARKTRSSWNTPRPSRPAAPRRMCRRCHLHVARLVWPVSGPLVCDPGPAACPEVPRPWGRATPLLALVLPIKRFNTNTSIVPQPTQPLGAPTRRSPRDRPPRPAAPGRS